MTGTTRPSSRATASPILTSAHVTISSPMIEALISGIRASTSAQALRMMSVKDSRTPRFFSFATQDLRKATTSAMSTRAKAVICAVDVRLCSMLRAMVLRRPASGRRRGARVAAGGAAAGAASRRVISASTSRRRMAPLPPVPVNPAGSIPAPCATRRAKGETRRRWPASVMVGASGCGTGVTAGAVSTRPAAPGTRLAASAAAFVSYSPPITLPMTCTVSTAANRRR